MGPQDCDPNAQNDLGNTPLHVCYVYGETKLGAILEAAGADPRMKNRRGIMACAANQQLLSACKTQLFNPHKVCTHIWIQHQMPTDPGVDLPLQVLPPRLLRKVHASPEWHRKKQKKGAKKLARLMRPLNRGPVSVADDTIMKQYAKQLRAGEISVGSDSLDEPLRSESAT